MNLTQANTGLFDRKRAGGVGGRQPHRLERYIEGGIQDVNLRKYRPSRANTGLSPAAMELAVNISPHAPVLPRHRFSTIPSSSMSMIPAA